ncbi:MAG: hypothetical protein K2Q26_01410 [Bdellovibrionales bacterium]|nr:hypothetical protein [Bdellovibrionales bacterium]
MRTRFKLFAPLVGLVVACTALQTPLRKISNQDSEDSRGSDVVYYFAPHQTTMVVQGKDIEFEPGRTSFEYKSGNSSCEFKTLSPVDPTRGFIIPAHSVAVLFKVDGINAHVDNKGNIHEANILYYFRAPGTNIISFTLKCFSVDGKMVTRISPGDLQLLVGPLATIASSGGLLKMNLLHRSRLP